MAGAWLRSILGDGAGKRGELGIRPAGQEPKGHQISNGHVVVWRKWQFLELLSGEPCMGLDSDRARRGWGTETLKEFS